MKKIIFVCTGGTCRSPMACEILKHKLKQKNIKGITVQSAGIMAEPNSQINPKSIKALKNLGIIVKSRPAKQLTIDMVTPDTLIIAITRQHQMYVKNVARTCSLYDFCGFDIFDIYGQSEEVYLECAKTLNEVCEKIAEQIAKGEL